VVNFENIKNGIVVFRIQNWIKRYAKTSFCLELPLANYKLNIRSRVELEGRNPKKE